MEHDIASWAWDATVGAGNDSEIVDFRVLKRHLKRDPTPAEMQTFDEAWRRCIQEMAQP